MLKPKAATALQISQAKLAELVALSLPTLQRVLRRLQQKGFTNYSGTVKLTARSRATIENMVITAARVPAT